MDKFAFWQQKIIQFFHDPVSKPFGGIPRVTGKLNYIAERLFDTFQENNTGRKLRYWYKSADWAAAGADRPMLCVAKKKGVSGLGSVRWPNEPVITHPFGPGHRLKLVFNAHTETAGTSEQEDAPEDEIGLPLQIVDEQDNAARDLAVYIKVWSSANDLQNGFMVLWRRYRDALMSKFDHAPLWQEMPSDSRIPDHSIWDHLKVTTALAFMKPHGWQDTPVEDADEPWMLRVSLGPVGRFIRQSRTSRDLWTSSFLLSDLAWHAMQPVVERYGPDCVMYPDLRANPRADLWLAQNFPDALPEGQDDPATFAAILPNAFVALVPRGGADHLVKIEDLAGSCRQRVADRWEQLQSRVAHWIEEKKLDGDGWRAIWDRQNLTCPIHVTWTAVPWRPLERINDEKSLIGQALPNQPERTPINKDDAEAIAARAARLQPWVPPEVWVQYERAREVYAASRLDYHQMERGFDYALTHHMLRVRHAMREATHPAPVPPPEPGEKCTLCGEREALHNDPTNHAAPLGALRQRGRDFWKAFDPDMTGEERLCAVCTTKRFLVEADQTPNDSVFNVIWTGPASLEELRDRDGRLRVPFPSTATVAAQTFLAKVVTRPECADAIAKVVQASRGAKLPRTSFPRALPRLARAERDALGNGAEFLKYEAEDVLFPEVLDGKIQGKLEENQNNLKVLRAAVADLRKAAKENGIEPPDTSIAVLHLDGDGMGKLLLGDAEAIAATWRDVLHPETLRRLERNDYLKEAGWGALLDAKRLMGPSLHAFVSRALGHFSHHIVPWVVEREFSGRLIYAGGDDVLCLAPADEAIELAARLQQLFSAAWVVDTQPDEEPWTWRHKNWNGNGDQILARQRFLIPLPRDEEQPIRFNDPNQPIARHVSDNPGESPRRSVAGALLPMLGSGASLSAGIAIGHYKTPLSRLTQRSKKLEKLAKKHNGGCLAVGHASRGGIKTGFAIPWNYNDALSVHHTLNTVIEGFRTGKLPSRLPYKLRELAPLVKAGLESIDGIDKPDEEHETERSRLLDGLFASCLDHPATITSDAGKAALGIWKLGVANANKTVDTAQIECFTDGLLLCRELAQGGVREESQS